jgi:hypothetical protein
VKGSLTADRISTLDELVDSTTCNLEPFRLHGISDSDPATLGMTTARKAMTRNPQRDENLGHLVHSILHIVAELESLALDMAYEKRNRLVDTYQEDGEPAS